MKKNMGTADKVIRVILAATIAGLFLANIISGTWGVILLIIAIVFLITSLISFCPLYTLLGINTCKKN